MILKVNINNGWMYAAELDKVELREMTRKEAQSLEYNKEFYCRKDNTEFVTLYYLFKKDIGLDKIIVCDINAVYLLNNEGKTIERLN